MEKEIQSNKVSGLAYQGNNQVDLLVAKTKGGYKSNEWLTFLQAKALGLKIKKGSKAVSVFKGFGSIEKINKEGKLKVESVPLGSAYVFNLDQTEIIK